MRNGVRICFGRTMNNVIKILHVKYVLHQTKRSRIKGRKPKENPRRKILRARGRNDIGKPDNRRNAAETAESVSSSKEK